MKWPEWIYHKKVSVLLSCIYSHECKVNSKLVLQGVPTSWIGQFPKLQKYAIAPLHTCWYTLYLILP